MKNYSLWLDSIDSEKYNSLNENLDVDVLIVGGGITGVSVAYNLIDKNLKVCLIERNKIGEGISARTTAKLTYLQENIYTKLNDTYSFSVAKLYYESQKDAIKIVKDIVKKNNIDCDLVNQRSYLFAKNKNELKILKKEKSILKRMGIDVKTDKQFANFKNLQNFYVNDTAYFHPVKYIKNLAKICKNGGIYIYENTNLLKINILNDCFECYVGNNKIMAKKVVMASHYPYFIIPFFFPLKGSIERSYISVSKSLKDDLISGINVGKNISSFRYYNDYFIYLNGSHNLAFDYNYKKKFVKLINNCLDVKYFWSNTDILTNDNLPYIGKLKDNLFIATGYNTWGMTNGSLAGVLISDLILKKHNRYRNLFDPKRKMPIICNLKIINNIFYSAKSFIENKIFKQKSFYPSNVKFVKRNNKNLAIYIDSQKKEHIVYNKCPHLKCSLIFNEKELTWDCPCHSSRFTIDGKCLTGPSNQDITYKKN